MSNIIDGKVIAQKREQKLKEKLQKVNIKPKVLSILVGEDPASVLYVNLKQKKAQELGIDFEIKHFDENSLFEKVANLIKQANSNPEINGIMIQLPLPKTFLNGHISKQLLNLINPQKDIDGLIENSPYLTAAVEAVLVIIDEENIDIKDKKCVVVGASDLIGKPIAQELEKRGGIVENLDSKTENLKEKTLQADILVSATGVANLIKGEMVKMGVVVIDVGVMVIEEAGQKDEEEKIVGDVDFEEVLKKASKITPVPGGVGPITVISLMENVVKYWERNK